MDNVTRKGPSNRDKLIRIQYRNEYVFIDSDEQGYVNSYRSGKLTAGFEIWRGESHDGDLVRAHGSHVFPPTDKKLSKNERKQSVRRYIESLINDSIKSPDEKDTLMSEQRTALVAEHCEEQGQTWRVSSDLQQSKHAQDAEPVGINGQQQIDVDRQYGHQVNHAEG